jgi:hypothetical protein
MVCTSVLRNKNATMTGAPELSVVDGGGLLPSPKKSAGILLPGGFGSSVSQQRPAQNQFMRL